MVSRRGGLLRRAQQARILAKAMLQRDLQLERDKEAAALEQRDVEWALALQWMGLELPE
jgi:hypothetical protein